MSVSGSSSHIRQRVEPASQSNLIFPVHEVQLSIRELNHQFSRTDGKTKRSSKNIHEKLICCIRNSLVAYRFGVRAKSCAFWTRPDCPKALVHRQKERPHTAPHAQLFLQIEFADHLGYSYERVQHGFSHEYQTALEGHKGMDGNVRPFPMLGRHSRIQADSLARRPDCRMDMCVRRT